VAELDIKLDRIDIEIDGLQRIRYEETKARLEALGIDTSNYRPPPPLTERELRCSGHLRPDDDVGALVREAKRTKLDRDFDEFIASRSPTVKTVDTSGQLLVRRGIDQVLGTR
jgi:hypothetical protein